MPNQRLLKEPLIKLISTDIADNHVIAVNDFFLAHIAQQLFYLVATLAFEFLDFMPVIVDHTPGYYLPRLIDTGDDIATGNLSLDRLNANRQQTLAGFL